MKSSALAAGLALLALALTCSAQEIVPPTPPAPPQAPPTDPRKVEVKNLDLVPPCMPAMVLNDNVLVGNPVLPPEYPHVWMDVDGVLWWLKPNRINVPLVTSTRNLEDLAATVRSGGVQDPNAVVLFGDDNFRKDPNVGGRVHIGAAVDTEATEVFEVSGFYLPWQVERFSAVSSDANGNPALALPFNEVFPNQPVETSGIVAGLFNGTFLHGSVLINGGTEMWGGEANFVKLLCTSCVGEFDLIVGFRYLHMEDYLTIDAQTDAADGGGSTHDRFETHNSFYGGQVGVRYVLDFENWRIEATDKFAVGDTNEVLDINGSATLPAYAAVAGGRELPGGFYTASSNIGNTSTNRFGFVDEVGVNVAYKLTDNVQLSAGYTFLYWDHIFRSGEQIDHNLNPGLNPAFSTITPGAGGGPASPQRLNAETSFWAQGINLGVRFSF